MFVELFLAFLLVISYLAYLDLKSKPTLPKGPKPLPFVGNALSLLNQDRFLHTFWKWHEEFGLTFRYSVPFQPSFIVTADPKNLEYILNSNFQNYVKGETFYTIVHELFGNGIFAVDGEQWKHQRKIASSLFTIRTFKESMEPVFHQHLSIVQSLINSSISQNETINFQDLVGRFTLDSAGEIAFGINISSLDVNNLHGKKYGKAFDFVQAVLSDRFFSPLPLTLRKKLHPDEVRFREDMKYLNSWAYSVIKARKLDQETQNKKDLLSFFLNHKIEKENGKMEKVEYSDEFLRDILLNFILAGRDTTANTMTWFFYVLSQPENQSKKIKIIQEIDSVLQRNEKKKKEQENNNNNSESKIFVISPATYEQTKKMKYLEAAVTETLRLYPSVPKELKSAVNDDVLPDGTKVRAGEWVQFTPWAMGRLESLWDNPLTFQPERFMEKQKPSNQHGNENNNNDDDDNNNNNEGEVQTTIEDTRGKSDPYKFVSFLAGPRMCLGQNMAYFQTKIVLSFILSNYDFELSPKDQPGQYVNQLTFGMKDGIFIKFTPRKD